MKTTSRSADFPIEPLILHRWSSRRLSGQGLTHADLAPLYEAARWAPSSGNQQPWRFVTVLPSDSGWAQWIDILNPGNRDWASRAGALVVLVSRRLVPNKREPGLVVNASHSFDAGAAWVCLALQASARGLVAHAMGGFDRERATAELRLDERYQVEVVIAVGHPAEAVSPTADGGVPETPNSRRPQADWVFAGQFQPDEDPPAV